MRLRLRIFPLGLLGSKFILLYLNAAPDPPASKRNDGFLQTGKPFLSLLVHVNLITFTVARWPNFRPNNSKEAPQNCPWPEKNLEAEK
jgi:hypothetical protein